MAECCVSGGRVVIKVNGQRWSARTAATIEFTTTERKVETNQDGSLAVTVKAMAPKAKFSLSNKCGLKLADLGQCNVDVTFDMIDARQKFYFTEAIVIGRPSINTETGEISGMEITAPEIKIVNY